MRIVILSYSSCERKGSRMIKKISENIGHQNDQEIKLQYFPEKPKFSWRERLARNLALSGMLVLTIVAVKDARLPSGKTILTGVQQMVDQNWDDNLGKISFVSNLLPESVAVFFESDFAPALIAPCFGQLSHSWQENEPYLGYQNGKDGMVYALASGQVMSIANGNAEEKIIRIRHDAGYEAVFYQLREVSVKEGDLVTENSCIAQTDPGAEFYVEVRKNGLPIDSGHMILPRGEEAL